MEDVFDPEDGDYVRLRDIGTGTGGFENAWQAGEGSGAATRQLQALFENPHASRAMSSLDASSKVRLRALAKLERDEQLAARTSQPIRSDIQRARRIIYDSGFSGLFAALKRGEALPAVAVPLIGLGLTLHQEEKDEL